MRRWRTADDRFLIEGDLPSGIQFYRLGRGYDVDRIYKEEKRMLAGELHQITFTMLGRQLMCRHIIDRGRSIEDQSRLELDKLEPLTPAEEPTEKVCREAVARYRLGAEKVEAAKRAKVDKLAEAAPESIRPTFRQLAERVVFDNDLHCRQMISIFAGLAAIRKEKDSGAAAEVTEMIELAAKLLVRDPSAKAAELPEIPETKTIALVDALDRLRGDLLGGGGGTTMSQERAASVLRVAMIKLLGGLA